MKKKKEYVSPYLPEEELSYDYGASGSPMPENYYLSATGTNGPWFPGSEYDLRLENPSSHNLEFDVDALWEKMYTRMLRVIVVCTHCGVPQTIDNGSCMRCGAPLPVPTRLGE